MKTLNILLALILGLYAKLYSQEFPDNFCLCEKQTIKSEILDQDRKLFVYLPTDYHKDTTKTYPVHYISDAPRTSNLYFDLIRLHAMTNDVPRSIVIGLSSDRRNENFNFKSNAGKYLEFVQNELIPFVEQHYRTKKYKVFAGHSAGGNFVMYTFLQNPELFNAYIAGSPGPVKQLIDFANNSAIDLKTEDYRFLYASVGTDNDTDTLSFRSLEKIMSENKAKDHEYHFKINQCENHISNIAVNFQDGFQKLYENWKFQLPDNLDKPISQVIQNHYDALEEKFGYKPKPGKWEVIFPTMDKLAKNGDFKNAIDILKYCIELYPESDQAYAFLAKVHFDTGKMEPGKKYLEKALEINPENRFARRIKAMLENRQN
jgi:predicted alpha/beta superfamily hydrolase